ncbi:MAG: DUF3782 domain-containing protein [Ignisphaera sp.]
MLSIEEKEKILRTLEIDKEFRYAVMGLIGYKEVLEGIMALNERVIKLEERFAELSERVAKLEERFARLEERVIKLEERFAELSERVAKLEERVLRVEEELRDLGRIMNAIAHRFGILTDEGFREAMKYVVEEALGVARVSRWIYYDDKGVVYQRPSIVEVDIVIRDREHILLEVKSRVDKSDLLELYRIGKLYEEVHNLKPKLVIIGAFFAKGVDELAKDLGIELKPIAKAYS